MATTILLRCHLNIFKANVPIGAFVLDAHIRKVHLVVEVRKVVFARPLFDFLLGPIGSPVAVAIASVALLQKTLILAFQFAVEFDAQDASVLLLEPFGGA